jgi:hypothetical protein
VPELVIGLPDTDNPVGTDISTLVTVPVVLEVPAPIAVLKSDALRALTVLSALRRTKVTAEGLVRVNRLLPTVVAPRLVRPVEAVKPVEPPSHFSLSVYAVSQLLWLAVVGIEYPVANEIAKVPELVIGVPLTDNPVGTDKATLVTVPV